MKLRNLALLMAMALAAAGGLVSCVTAPIVVPEDVTPAELIQRGQEASEKNRYAHSLQYYSAIIERFPYDIDSICAAEYEIAFVYYKQKNYDAAKENFNTLLNRYNTPDEELLPPQYKILSRIVLAKIEETENARKRK